MSAPNTLDELLKIAVVGLQNSSDFQSALPEDVAALMAAKSYHNEAQQFLHGAALTWLQAELARIPEPDTFDELPSIGEEHLQALSPEQSLMVERLINHEQLSPGSSALHLLQRYGYALPDLLFCDLLEAERLDKSTALVLREVASARSRWLSAMNPRWQSLLGLAAEETPFHQARSSEQMWQLANMPSNEIGGFCLQQWQQCNVNGRRLLLSYLRSYFFSNPSNNSGSDSSAGPAQWLVEHINDKSSAIKRELIRWFVTCDHPEAEVFRQKAQAQLKLYLDNSNARKPDLTVPEKLDDELIELGVIDQDYLGTNLPKPVQRLAQLLVLVGPQAWAQHLGCDSAAAMERLLKTRFGEELQAYLLEAALYHNDEAALESWCKKIKLKERSRLPEFLSTMLYQLGPQQSLRSVKSILQYKQIGLLLSAKVWQLLVNFSCALAPDIALNFFEQWCQYIVKHRYVFDREVASMLPLWLDLQAQQIQQNKYWRALRDKQKFPADNLDLLESLFQLKSGLHLSCQDNQRKNIHPDSLLDSDSDPHSSKQPPRG